MTAVLPLDRSARRAWQARQDTAGRQELPAPVRTSRDPMPYMARMPGGPARLEALAQRCGWTTRLTYSAGPWLGGRGTPLRRCLGMRARLGEKFAMAFYLAPLTEDDWTFENAIVAGGPVGVYTRCNVTDVKGYLRVGGQVSAEWFAAITVRVVDAAARAKASAAQRPRKIREGAS